MVMQIKLIVVVVTRFRTGLRRKKRVLNALRWLIIESLWAVLDLFQSTIALATSNFCDSFFFLTDHDLPSANNKIQRWVRILVQGDFVYWVF